jgi:Flp pilus assembly protein TadG
MRRLRAFAGDETGTAAVEMALVGAILTAALLNVAELSRYAYMVSEVTAASQAGAQAALVTCDPGETPVTINCPAVNSAIQVAVTGTSLGDQIKLSGALNEGWYCVDTNGGLQYMSAASSKPTDCSSVGLPAARPALYIKLTTTYTYVAMFPGLTLAQRLPQTIARTAWMRML